MVWCQPWALEAAGSNPADPTIFRTACTLLQSLQSKCRAVTASGSFSMPAFRWHLAMRAFPCSPRAKQDGSEEGKDPRCYGVTHDRVCHAILRQLSKIKLSSVESRGSVQAGCIMSATRTKNIGGNWLSLPISEAEHFNKIFARWARPACGTSIPVWQVFRFCPYRIY